MLGRSRNTLTEVAIVIILRNILSAFFLICLTGCAANAVSVSEDDHEPLSPVDNRHQEQQAKWVLFLNQYKTTNAGKTDFDELLKRAAKSAEKVIDTHNVCHAIKLFETSFLIYTARAADPKKAESVILSSPALKRLIDFPAIKFAALSQTFFTASNSASYLTNKIYQSSCPGSFFCSAENLELFDNGHFAHSVPTNGDEFSACLTSGQPPTSCKLKVEHTKGIWKKTGLTLGLSTEKNKEWRTMIIHNADNIGDLWYPDPNDGSGYVEDEYRGSCAYIPN